MIINILLFVQDVTVLLFVTFYSFIDDFRQRCRSQVSVLSVNTPPPLSAVFM